MCVSSVCVQLSHRCALGGVVVNFSRHGDLAWAGFTGVELVLRDVRRFNNMGHSLLQNIREVRGG